MTKTKVIALAIAIAALKFVTAADAADLKVFGGGGFDGSGKPLVEAFDKKNGLMASFTGGNTLGPALKKRLDAGEQMDVVIEPSDDMEGQIKAGLIKPGSVVDFARYRMGVGIAKGAPRPDVSTKEKFRAALLAAKAVSIPNPNDLTHHTGQFMHQILIDLGITDEIEKKAIISGRPASAVADGRAALSIGSLPELMQEPKADVAGPVPADLPGYTTLSVGILTNGKDDTDAQAFTRFLTSPEGAAVWMKTGLEALPKAGR